MKKKVSERQKEILSILRKHFRENESITAKELSKIMDVNPITAYEHLRNLKEKGILKVEMAFCKKKGRPRYKYVLTEEGRRLLNTGVDFYVDEVKNILKEFVEAKEEGRLNELLMEKVSNFSKNTLKPLIFIVFAFLVLVTLFRDVREIEVLKDLLMMSLSSKIVFVSFASLTVFLFSKYVGGVGNIDKKWEDAKYHFVSIPDEQREEIIRILTNFMYGGEKDGCKRELDWTYS